MFWKKRKKPDPTDRQAAPTHPPLVPPPLPKSAPETPPPLPVENKIEQETKNKNEQDSGIYIPLSPHQTNGRFSVFNENGTRFELTHDKFIESIKNNIRQNYLDAESLYQALLHAYKSGVIADFVDEARQLRELEPSGERSAVMLGGALSAVGNVKEAESVLQAEALKRPTGVVLSNLGLMKDQLGDKAAALRLTRESLAYEPNQEMTLQRYALLCRDSEKGSFEQAMEEISIEPDAWLARFWLARTALQKGQHETALNIYRESLTRFNISEYGMTMISGDLGNAGLARDMFSLLWNVYDPEMHGVPTGINLIEAAIEIGELEKGLNICKLLEALDRKDILGALADYRSVLEGAKKPLHELEIPRPKFINKFLMDLQPMRYPFNALEKAISSYITGSLDHSKLLEILLNSEVYLLRTSVEDEQRGIFISFFHLNFPEYKIIAAFSDKNRAKDMISVAPSYNRVDKIEFGKLLFAAREGVGFALNPHLDTGLLLTPEDSEDLRRLAKK